jgi:hypothetical protein
MGYQVVFIAQHLSVAQIVRGVSNLFFELLASRVWEIRFSIFPKTEIQSTQSRLAQAGPNQSPFVASCRSIVDPGEFVSNS